MSKKCEAIFFSDGEGMYTVGCLTKEQAIRAMQREWDSKSDLERYGCDAQFNDHTITESRAYMHRDCTYRTMEEPTCGYCGEDFKGGRGVRTFVIYF